MLSRLSATGLPVVALAEVPQRLEEVYLRIVSEEQADLGALSPELEAA